VKLEWRPVALGGYGSPTIDTSLTADETRELQRLAADADVLEIGSAYGYSAVAMALVGARVTAVDPHTWLGSYDVMVSNLKAYAIDPRVDILQDLSFAILPLLAESGYRFDLVWIDGDHEAPSVTHDVEWARKLLRPTGTLACHDYDEDTCPGVRQALDAWKPPAKLIDTLAIYGPGEW
jgi:predicted O-methyltransferase YrrM